jgi:hypothetical protein
VRLTTTQVSLIAAAIALAAPAITYRANARLDRYRWVRERRAETYIDALAVLGRLAPYVSEPDRRADPFDALPGGRWAPGRAARRPGRSASAPEDQAEATASG